MIKKTIAILASLLIVGTASALEVTVHYTVPISDNVDVQNSLKAMLDQEIDPENAGGQYVARFKKALKWYGTRGLKERLKQWRTRDVIEQMRASQQALEDETTVSEGVDN